MKLTSAICSYIPSPPSRLSYRGIYTSLRFSFLIISHSDGCLFCNSWAKKKKKSNKINKNKQGGECFQ